MSEEEKEQVIYSVDVDGTLHYQPYLLNELLISELAAHHDKGDTIVLNTDISHYTIDKALGYLNFDDWPITGKDIKKAITTYLRHSLLENHLKNAYGKSLCTTVLTPGDHVLIVDDEDEMKKELNNRGITEPGDYFEKVIRPYEEAIFKRIEELKDEDQFAEDNNEVNRKIPKILDEIKEDKEISKLRDLDDRVDKRIEDDLDKYDRKNKYNRVDFYRRKKNMINARIVHYDDVKEIITDTRKAIEKKGRNKLDSSTWINIEFDNKLSILKATQFPEYIFTLERSKSDKEHHQLSITYSPFNAYCHNLEQQLAEYLTKKPNKHVTRVNHAQNLLEQTQKIRVDHNNMFRKKQLKGILKNLVDEIKKNNREQRIGSINNKLETLINNAIKRLESLDENNEGQTSKESLQIYQSNKKNVLWHHTQLTKLLSQTNKNIQVKIEAGLPPISLPAPLDITQPNGINQENINNITKQFKKLLRETKTLQENLLNHLQTLTSSGYFLNENNQDILSQYITTKSQDRLPTLDLTKDTYQLFNMTYLQQPVGPKEQDESLQIYSTPKHKLFDKTFETINKDQNRSPQLQLLHSFNEILSSTQDIIDNTKKMMSMNTKHLEEKTDAENTIPQETNDTINSLKIKLNTLESNLVELKRDKALWMINDQGHVTHTDPLTNSDYVKKKSEKAVNLYNEMTENTNKENTEGNAIQLFQSLLSDSYSTSLDTQLCIGRKETSETLEDLLRNKTAFTFELIDNYSHEDFFKSFTFESTSQTNKAASVFHDISKSDYHFLNLDQLITLMKNENFRNLIAECIPQNEFITKTLTAALVRYILSPTLTDDQRSLYEKYLLDKTLLLKIITQDDCRTYLQALYSSADAHIEKKFKDLPALVDTHIHERFQKLSNACINSCSNSENEYQVFSTVLRDAETHYSDALPIALDEKEEKEDNENKQRYDEKKNKLVNVLINKSDDYHSQTSWFPFSYRASSEKRGLCSELRDNLIKFNNGDDLEALQTFITLQKETVTTIDNNRWFKYLRPQERQYMSMLDQLTFDLKNFENSNLYNERQRIKKKERINDVLKNQAGKQPYGKALLTNIRLEKTKDGEDSFYKNRADHVSLNGKPLQELINTVLGVKKNEPQEITKEQFIELFKQSLFQNETDEGKKTRLATYATEYLNTHNYLATLAPIIINKALHNYTDYSLVKNKTKNGTDPEEDYIKEKTNISYNHDTNKLSITETSEFSEAYTKFILTEGEAPDDKINQVFKYTTHSTVELDFTDVLYGNEKHPPVFIKEAYLSSPNENFLSCDIDKRLKEYFQQLRVEKEEIGACLQNLVQQVEIVAAAAGTEDKSSLNNTDGTGENPPVPNLNGVKKPKPVDINLTDTQSTLYYHQKTNNNSTQKTNHDKDHDKDSRSEITTKSQPSLIKSNNDCAPSVSP